VYVIHSAEEARYSHQHNTSFEIKADGKKVFKGTLSNFGTSQEGSLLVEPLIGFWDFNLVKSLALAEEVTFVLGGDKKPVEKGLRESLGQMVGYFQEKPGV
jgi:hypothetical protein